MKLEFENKKELTQIMEEEEIKEHLATPLLCSKKGGFVKYKKLIPYCSVDYECLYKAHDNKCMSIKYR